MGKSSRRKAIARDAYEVLVEHFEKVAMAMTNLLPDHEVEGLREEERQDPTYLETDAIIWNYRENRFVPNAMHLKNEAKRYAATDPVYEGRPKLTFKLVNIEDIPCAD